MEKRPAERALVFGDDMRIFLAVVRSLGRAGLEVHAAPFNWSAPALKSKYVHRVHVLPRYSDDAIAWRKAVSELLQDEHFDLIVPCCDDRSIIAFHLNKNYFRGQRIALPDVSNIDLLFDKEQTHELADSLAIPMARSARLLFEDDVRSLISRYGLPLVLKPRRSYWPDKLDGWGKVFIPKNEQQLRDALGQISDRSRYLVESYFVGAGVGVSVLADGGNILHAFQHRRLREGWGGSSSYRLSEELHAELYAAVEKICKAVNLSGVCMFEFRFNMQSQDWVLLETNARFWGSLPLPVSLGIDFPLYLYDLLVHRRYHPRGTYDLNVRSRNVVLDGFNLLAGIARLRIRDAFGWMQEACLFLAHPLLWMCGIERSDSFVWDDIRPGLYEASALLKSSWRRLVLPQASAQKRRQHEVSSSGAASGLDAVQKSNSKFNILDMRWPMRL
jgi:predicted ATP-grasp superfamily ATP-dependent carboligase